MSRLFIFGGILLVGILPRNILLRGIFLRRDFAGRDFSVEGFGERDFWLEGFTTPASKKSTWTKIWKKGTEESWQMTIKTLITSPFKSSNLEMLYTPFRNERDNLFHYFSVMKSSKNKFYFFTCILPDYVAHESPKEFWKNIDFENVRAGFLLRWQNSLRQTTPWNDAFSAMIFIILTNISWSN
mgnify:CR=1 FL=1